MAKTIFNALGLMSGTSMDGIDAALLRTDGESLAEPLAAMSFPYDGAMRRLLVRALREAKGISRRNARPGVLAEAEAAVTEAHIGAVRAFRAAHDLPVDVIGFHGQTVAHRPGARLTVQIGDGAALARATGVDTVWDMRANDVAHGGQGAPMVPVYHRALAARAPARPVVFVNIGGVANVTWTDGGERLLAFDAGPGNALLDDWLMRHAGEPFDRDGALAARGRADASALARYLSAPFFALPPPKSLDRGDFGPGPVEGLSPADGAATLTALTAKAIARTADWFPQPARLWIVCGGGRRNRRLMSLLAEEISAPVAPAEAVGLDGDMLEAQAWAFLAVRSLRGLPLTWPETTGAPGPLPGGRLSEGGAGRREEARA